MQTLTRKIQEQMTPDQALDRLMEGNRRFINGEMLPRDYKMQVQDTSGGQYPFAAILGCIDSRASAEQVFDQGIGDIFNARVAGNIVNDDILGSLEYACNVAGAKLVLVLGHTSCGAVTAACNQVELGNITTLLSKIQPAVKAFSEPAEDVDAVSAHNAQLSVEQIRQQSQILNEMERNGDINIRGAIYDVASGLVRLLGV